MNSSQLSTECQVCLEDIAEPRSLPCGHTYCKKCLQQLIDSANKISCPSDRRMFTLPDGNADNLPRNFFLESLLENLRANRTRTAAVACAAAEHAHAHEHADFFCESCLKSLCSGCVLSHNGHELKMYSESRDRCALRIHQLQANIRQFQQAVENAQTAKAGAVDAQVAACKRKVDAAVNKIREIVQILHATADGLENAAAQCRRFLETAFEIANLESLQRDVAALGKAAISLNDTSTDFRLESRFEKVHVLTQQLEIHRQVMRIETTPQVSRCFPNSQLTHRLDTIMDNALKLLSFTTENNQEHHFSLCQLQAALNEAAAEVQSHWQTSAPSSQTQQAALLQPASQFPAVQVQAAASNTSMAVNLPVKPTDTPTETVAESSSASASASATPAAAPLTGSKSPSSYPSPRSQTASHASSASSVFSRTFSKLKKKKPASSPTALQQHEEVLFLVGGYQNTQSFAYDSSSGAWSPSPVAAMSCERGWTAATLWIGKMVVAGGWNDTDKYLNTVEQFDPESNSWTALPHMLHRRRDLGLASFGNTLFAIGGWDGPDIQNSVERYNLDTNQWQLAAPLKVRRAGLCCAVLADGILAAGGYDGSSRLATCELLGDSGQRWRSVASLKAARNHASAASLNGKVYVFGGEDQNWEDLDSVEEYDSASDSWTWLPVRLSVARSARAAATVNGKIYICGGSDYHDSSVVDSFDARLVQITRVAPLPVAVGGAVAVSVAVADETRRRLFQVQVARK